MENLTNQLDDCNTLAEIFELVKQSVKTFLNRHRAGLMLGLANLGMRRGHFVGALHPVGSNIIVMNRAPLETAIQTTDKRILNAYCFHLLLHEYLHSLGYVNEGEVRELTCEVCRLALGEGHPATIMAERGIAHYFPKVTYFTREFPLPRDLQIELIKDFDKSSVKYIH
ncbi:MAG: hypothetical protein AOA65_1477 [Candidatus Bathyarchaeota archaeon BA1]|nr:MAG: hypothetical protein AOA65_1477 [Candidatus Bathyarchaeota archaeon BA1]